MQGTVDGFGYGLVTPVAAFVMAWLGGALGLRCAVRSVRDRRSFKAGWAALGATAIGSGVWSMHFIAMMGFGVDEAPVAYDRPVVYAGLGVAVLMTGIGIFLVGHRGATPMALTTGGTIIGLGIASMHYLGMAGMRLQGALAYDTVTVAASVVIAVVAATTALWAAVSGHGLLAGLGAGLLMGVAVSGMHYTGMAAMSVHLHAAAGTAGTGDDPAALLIPMLIGPVIFLVLAGVVVMFDPLLMPGEPDRRAPASVDARPGVPAQRTGSPSGQRSPGRAVGRGERHRSDSW
ncbi:MULTISPECIES: MHYT domain-containing protein [unclassified Streptomyces]|uniref:MHYT domain-containing protein n=1 Tax=unclassified Streptomyces TaxID=2593676 RepID=UPI00331B25D3